MIRLNLLKNIFFVELWWNCYWLYFWHFQIFTGVSVTLKHPYERDIPEPTQYEHVTRHAELGKRTSFETDMSKATPDLHVSRALWNM